MHDDARWWWNDRDEIFTVTVDVLAQLHIRAMECGAYRDAAGLAEAWIELVQGPWRRATFVLNQPLPYAAAVASLDELLARLQELTNDQAGRLAIARAHDHVAHVAPDLPARVVGR